MFIKYSKFFIVFSLLSLNFCSKNDLRANNHHEKIDSSAVGNFNSEYIKSAMILEGKNYDNIIKRTSKKRSVRLISAAMGLSTEANEILDPIRKHIIYGKELDEINLKEELGDLFWYMALMCDELGVSFEEIMNGNIAKLKARYPNKFQEEAALNRDLKKEKLVLEKSFKKN